MSGDFEVGCVSVLLRSSFVLGFLAAPALARALMYVGVRCLLGEGEVFGSNLWFQFCFPFSWCCALSLCDLLVRERSHKGEERELEVSCVSSRRQVPIDPGGKSLVNEVPPYPSHTYER